MTPDERFWSKVDASGDCWVWTASVTHNGYGHFSFGGRAGGMVRAHRHAYEMLVGRIPEGMDLDHLCRVRRCVNPDHLEPVSRRVNLLRGATLTARLAARTSCNYGHPFTDANTYIDAGRRRCRRCTLDRQARARLSERRAA